MPWPLPRVERGRLSRIRSLVRSPQFWAALASAIILALCYAACFSQSGMLYLTNDDMSIQETLSGARVGEPYPLSWFISVIASVPISALYRIAPGVQWWFIYSHVLQAIGIFLVNYCTIQATARSSWVVRILCVALAIAFDLAFLIYPTTKIAFTIVPGILGAGVVLLVFLSTQRRTADHWICCLVLFVLLLAHREETGLIVLCYVLLALLAGCVLEGRDGTRTGPLLRFVALAGILLAVTAVAVLGNRVIQDDSNGQEFREYTDARSSFVDYGHDPYNPADPVPYKDVGWNADLFSLVNNWCFMDQRVSTQSFTYVVEHQKAKDWTVGAEHEWNQLMNHPLAAGVLAMWVIVSIGACLSLLVGARWVPLGMQVLNMWGTLAILAMQLLLGRILYRTVLVAVVPSTALAIVLVARAYRGQRWPWAHVAFCALALVALGVGAQDDLRVSFDRARIAPLVRESRKAETLLEYAIAHPDLVYVKGPSAPTSTNPNKTYPTDQPSNVIAWGGTEHTSRVFRTRLAVNDLDSFGGDVFARDNVRVVSGISLGGIDYALDGTDALSTFLRWQRDAYGAKGVVQVASPCYGVYILRMIYDDEDQSFYDQYFRGFILPIYDEQDDEPQDEGDEDEEWAEDEYDEYDEYGSVDWTDAGEFVDAGDPYATYEPYATYASPTTMAVGW